MFFKKILSKLKNIIVIKYKTIPSSLNNIRITIDGNDNFEKKDMNNVNKKSRDSISINFKEIYEKNMTSRKYIL